MLDILERDLRSLHVRLDIPSADLDMVECDFDCFGPDVGHLSTREWTHGDVNQTPQVRKLGSGNVMLDYRVRNVGQTRRIVGHIRTWNWTYADVKRTC